MEKFRRIEGILFIVFFVFMVGCTGIGTEAGNPEETQPVTQGPDQTGDDTGSTTDDDGTTSGTGSEDLTYIDEVYSFSFQYGSSFDVEEISGAQVTSDGVLIAVASSDDVSLDFFITVLESEPSSLASYLVSTYPGITFDSYSNENISGYYYDNPASGESGGDRKDYYFLNGTTLLHVVVEILGGGGESAAESILSTVEFVE